MTQTAADREFCDDIDPPYDRIDETEWDDELPDDRCLSCDGTGIVNPLTAPPGFLCITYSTCPHCEGTGRDE